MHEGAAALCGHREAVRIPDVANDALQVLKCARVRAFAHVRNDLVSRGLKPAQGSAADAAGRPCDQNPHARLVTGSAAFTNR